MPPTGHPIWGVIVRMMYLAAGSRPHAGLQTGSLGAAGYSGCGGRRNPSEGRGAAVPVTQY